MKKVAIRLDAGKSIGLGHLMRCIALAEVLQKQCDVVVIFICRNKLRMKIRFNVIYLNREYVTDINNYDFPSICDELDEIKGILWDRKIDCLIVDHYGAEDEYYEQLRDCVPLLVCIDDGKERHIPVDVMINGNVYAEEADYTPVAVQLLGGKYTLLKSEFANLPKRSLNKAVQDVYITSGGADPIQFCEKIVAALQEMHLNIETHVIVGVDFEPEYVRKLAEYHVKLHQNADMKKCMLEADLFISAAGSTLYELAVTGTPSLSYILADDQLMVGEKMWEKNCSMRGGRFSEFEPQKFFALISQLLDYDIRRIMSKRAQKVIQYDGAMNVAKEIGKLLSESIL